MTWDTEKTIKSEVQCSINYLDPCRALNIHHSLCGLAWLAICKEGITHEVFVLCILACPSLLQVPYLPVPGGCLLSMLGES